MQKAEGDGHMEDPLAPWMRDLFGGQPLLQALRAVHQPESDVAMERGRQTLAFVELLGVQLRLLIRRHMAW